MKITIAAATRFEIKEDSLQKITIHDIQFLYTGVGILSSAVSLTQHLFQQKPDLILQAGIAGCFKTFLLGDVVVVEKEYAGDTGVWEKEEWKDLFDMNFQQEDEKPFKNNCLPNENIDKLNVLQLPTATGVTINEITTNNKRKEMLATKYKADIETMEGASLHYVCRLFAIPFLQIRGVSNSVGERDKKEWKIKEAIDNVNEAVKKILPLLQK